MSSLMALGGLSDELDGSSQLVLVEFEAAQAVDRRAALQRVNLQPERRQVWPRLEGCLTQAYFDTAHASQRAIGGATALARVAVVNWRR